MKIQEILKLVNQGDIFLSWDQITKHKIISRTRILRCFMSITGLDKCLPYYGNKGRVGSFNDLKILLHTKFAHFELIQNVSEICYFSGELKVQLSVVKIGEI